MGRQRGREKFVTPNPYFLSTIERDEKILQAGFESYVFEEIQRARGCPTACIKQYPTGTHGFFALEDLDIGCTVEVVNRRFDPEDIIAASDKLRALYDAGSADIVVVNDFNRQSYRGVALVALGVIQYEDMIGVITTIPNPDCSPIYLGRSLDIFATLVAAGLIPKWDGTL